jgi:hypothetical protein
VLSETQKKILKAAHSQDQIFISLIIFFLLFWVLALLAFFRLVVVASTL